MIEFFDNSKTYKIEKSGELFWTIFNYATLNLLYIYPQFFQWFEKKVITGLNLGNRIILASLSSKGKVAGYSILKNDKEQKICTLQILPQYRRQGHAKELFDTACNILSTPIITVNENQLDLYSSLLFERNFFLVEKVKNLYTDNSTEYIFKKE